MIWKATKRASFHYLLFHFQEDMVSSKEQRNETCNYHASIIICLAITVTFFPPSVTQEALFVCFLRENHMLFGKDLCFREPGL